VKISPEGEMKNKCLMKGYYKAPEITASVLMRKVLKREI
jgi:long-subunit acyl-CoA synthetase (AMP-forming)